MAGLDEKSGLGSQMGLMPGAVVRPDEPCTVEQGGCGMHNAKTQRGIHPFQLPCASRTRTYSMF